jgi:hypothetical protein
MVCTPVNMKTSAVIHTPAPEGVYSSLDDAHRLPCFNDLTPSPDQQARLQSFTSHPSMEDDTSSFVSGGATAQPSYVGGPPPRPPLISSRPLYNNSTQR